MTRNERALKIAEYEGWVESNENYIRDESVILECDLIPKYSTFDDLVKVCFDINPFSNIEIHFLEQNGYIKIYDIYRNELNHFDFTDAETLIDALQQAIIFYYENR